MVENVGVVFRSRRYLIYMKMLWKGCGKSLLSEEKKKEAVGLTVPAFPLNMRNSYRSVNATRKFYNPVGYRTPRRSRIASSQRNFLSFGQFFERISATPLNLDTQETSRLTIREIRRLCYLCKCESVAWCANWRAVDVQESKSQGARPMKNAMGWLDAVDTVVTIEREVA